MEFRSFRDLEAWQVGMEFVTLAYALTRSFPREELYGLTSQLRRAAIAIPSNISEGHQQGTKAYIHHITIALDSLAEAETQLELAARLELAGHDDIRNVREFAVRLRQILYALRRSLINRGIQGA
jgi:four helix bundle protein